MYYFKLHTTDYTRKTQALSQGEHGCYLLMMLEAYRSESGIDPEDVYSICKCSNDEERRNADRVVRKFWPKGADGLLHQSRIDEEVYTFRNGRGPESSRVNGAKGGRPKKNPLKDLAGEAQTSGQIVWDDGLKMLIEHGMKEINARRYLGSLCKDWKADDVLDAVRAALEKRATNPTAYIRAVLKSRPKKVRVPDAAKGILAMLRERFGQDVDLARDGQSFADRAGRRWGLDGEERAAA